MSPDEEQKIGGLEQNLSHTKCVSSRFAKAIFTQICQIILYISDSQGGNDGSVGKLTLVKRL